MASATTDNTAGSAGRVIVVRPPSAYLYNAVFQRCVLLLNFFCNYTMQCV